MKAKVRFEKHNRRRIIVLSSSQLLITFHDNIEAQNAYARLKSEMKKDGWQSWVPFMSKSLVNSKIKNTKVIKEKVLGLPLKEKK